MSMVHITAHLLAGIECIPGEVLSLDGPLLYAAVRDRMGDAFHSVRPSNEQLARLTAAPDAGVPLHTAARAGTWVYQVSGGHLSGMHGSTRHHWHTRLDDGMLVNAVRDGVVDMGRTTKVSTAAGPYRAVRMPVDTVMAERIEWVALTPDIEALERALSSIQHIGKGRNAGGGVVARWEVVTLHEASESRWMFTADGDLTRPLPIVLMDQDWDGPHAWAPVRPPYWLVQHQEWCAMPRTESL